jgi:hypothetical protein
MDRGFQKRLLESIQMAVLFFALLGAHPGVAAPNSCELKKGSQKSLAEIEALLPKRAKLCSGVAALHEPPGTVCVTSDRQHEWIRRKEGWQEKEGGPIWRVELHPRTDPREALDRCKALGGTLPNRDDFMFGVSRGLLELFDESLAQGRYWVNEVNRRSKIVSSFDGRSGFVWSTDSCINDCETFCVSYDPKSRSGRK